jgi:hypothetical protein
LLLSASSDTGKNIEPIMAAVIATIVIVIPLEILERSGM